MLKIDLLPTLSQCIETVAKKEYDETVRQLLASGEHDRKLLEEVCQIRSLCRRRSPKV